MKTLTLSGKILYALPMAIFGFGHFGPGAEQMAAMVPSYIPGGIFWIYFTGLALLAAAVSIVIGKYTKLAGILLGALLLIFAFTLWLPLLGNEQMKQVAFPAFMKDIALAGAAFLIAGVSTATENNLNSLNYGEKKIY